MVSWPFMSCWCATWWEFTIHVGVEVVGLLERYLIVFHALLLLFVRFVDVMILYHLFFSSIILSTGLVPASSNRMCFIFNICIIQTMKKFRNFHSKVFSCQLPVSFAHKKGVDRVARS